MKPFRPRPDAAAGLRFWEQSFGPPKKKAAGLAPKAAFKLHSQVDPTSPRRARQRGGVDHVVALLVLVQVVLAINLWMMLS